MKHEKELKQKIARHEKLLEEFHQKFEIVQQLFSEIKALRDEINPLEREIFSDSPAESPDHMMSDTHESEDTIRHGRSKRVKYDYDYVISQEDFQLMLQGADRNILCEATIALFITANNQPIPLSEIMSRIFPDIINQRLLMTNIPFRLTRSDIQQRPKKRYKTLQEKHQQTFRFFKIREP